MEELFSGNKSLFEGLWIENQWDWTETNPVIHFSFSNLGVNTEGFVNGLFNGLRDNAKRLGVELTEKSYDRQFQELIRKAAVKGQVVILIDEYDKPLIGILDQPEKVAAHYSIIRNFCSILKDDDEYIRFMFMTGVTQLSRLNLFSDLNNLKNITLQSNYANLTGISQKELEDNFKVELSELKKEHQIFWIS